MIFEHSGSPSTIKWQIVVLIILIMEKVYLNVKLVQAVAPVSHNLHTAYTVYSLIGSDGLQVASGWSIKDAIRLYARLYRCNLDTIYLIRPFRNQ